MILPIHTLDHGVGRDICKKYGGMLPEPREDKENQFLDHLDTNMFVLGMNNNNQDQVYVWDSDGTHVQFSRWLNDKPINSDTYCVIMMRNLATKETHNSDRWMQIPCNGEGVKVDDSYNDISLICQRDTGVCISIYHDVLVVDIEKHENETATSFFSIIIIKMT